jgi:hypothetical protein
MADWTATPTVTLGDTTWTLVGLSSLPGVLNIELDNLTGLRITDNNGGLTSGSYTLNYDLGISSGTVFTGVEVDSTRNSGTTDVIKSIYDHSGGTLLAGPLDSHNGSDVSASITGAPSSIYVAESVTIVGGRLNNFANTYTVVPEPTTMIAGALLLLPFGASTLRILRRRTV